MLMLILLIVPLILESMLQASTQPPTCDTTGLYMCEHWVFTLTLQPKPVGSPYRVYGTL